MTITSNGQPSEASPSLPTSVAGETPGLWKPLSELKPAKGGKKPIEVMFPDETRNSVKVWKHMMFSVVRWLASNGWLDEDKCPIAKAEGSASYLVSATPMHATGTAFKAPQMIGALHVETAGVVMRSARPVPCGSVQHVRPSVEWPYGASSWETLAEVAHENCCVNVVQVGKLHR